MPTINDYDYVSWYCKKPRGRKIWEFLPGDGAGRVLEDVPSAVTPTFMTFSDARRWAKKKLSGYPELHVLP